MKIGNLRIYVVFFAAFGLVACRSDRPAPKVEQVRAPDRRPTATREQPDDTTTTKDVDEMDESELQMACFDGSQAACDTLGH